MNPTNRGSATAVDDSRTRSHNYRLPRARPIGARKSGKIESRVPTRGWIFREASLAARIVKSSERFRRVKERLGWVLRLRSVWNVGCSGHFCNCWWAILWAIISSVSKFSLYEFRINEKVFWFWIQWSFEELLIIFSIDVLKAYKLTTNVDFKHRC